MSDTFLKLIPVDPNFVPGAREQSEAVAILVAAFPAGEDAEAEVYDTVTFIDNGENTEAIVCTVCDRRLDFADDDAAEIMEQIHEALEAESLTNQVLAMPVAGLRSQLPRCSSTGRQASRASS
jgi:hypothetical protein